MSLDWKGDELTAKMRRAQLFGVNKTMSEAVLHAKRHHQWRNRTGTLEGSIQIAEFASRGRKGVSGLWGSLDVRYAIALELGFSGSVTVPAHTRRITQAFGRPITPTTVNVRQHSRQMDRPAMPFLRPAADAVYPDLARNIRIGLERQ